MSNSTSTRTPRFDVDFADGALAADPYSICDEIREVGSVVWNEAAQGWMVVGWAECVEVLDDPNAERFGVVWPRHPEVNPWFEAPSMIVADGADHRRLRQGVSRYFTPTAIKTRWEPRVREVVESLLAPLMGGDGTIDLVGDFTKIPVIIVAELLGVPEERHEEFRRWSHAIVSNLRFGQESVENQRIMDRTLTELRAYLSAAIEEHRRDQPDDLLTVMVNIPDWSEAEINSSALLMLIAGYDTTAKLLGECLVALENHSDQRRLLVEHPELIPNAVEEVLRCYGATQAITRLAVRDTTLGEAELKDDDMLFVMLAAGNRDPARWADPHRFDVRRAFKSHLGQPHLGFALGPHVCIGAPLARLEVQIALETLLRLAPDYHLRDINYGDSFFARGPEQGIIEAQAMASQ